MKNKFRLIHMALRINAATYNQIVFDNGIEWIRRNMALNDDVIVFEIAKSELFWAWWRNQWELRDNKFIYQASLLNQELPFSDFYLKIAREAYMDHNALNEIKVVPNRHVIADIGKYLNERRKQDEQILINLLYGNKPQ